MILTKIPAKIPTEILIHEVEPTCAWKDAVNILHLKSIDLTMPQCRDIVSGLRESNNGSFKATITKDMDEHAWRDFRDFFVYSQGIGPEEVEEKTLKLFKVTVYITSSRKNTKYKALVLSLDERGAKAIVGLDTPMSPGEEVFQMDVEELEGPFKNGQTLMIQKAI